MEEQRSPLQFRKNEDLHSTAVGRALWQTVRRPRRGRLQHHAVEQRGPYETSYSVISGYPDREIVTP